MIKFIFIIFNNDVTGCLVKSPEYHLSKETRKLPVKKHIKFAIPKNPSDTFWKHERIFLTTSNNLQNKHRWQCLMKGCFTFLAEAMNTFDRKFILMINVLRVKFIFIVVKRSSRQIQIYNNPQ